MTPKLIQFRWHAFFLLIQATCGSPTAQLGRTLILASGVCLEVCHLAVGTVRACLSDARSQATDLAGQSWEGLLADELSRGRVPLVLQKVGGLAE